MPIYASAALNWTDCADISCCFQTCPTCPPAYRAGLYGLSRRQLLFLDLLTCRQSWAVQTEQTLATLSRLVNMPTELGCVDCVYISCRSSASRSVYSKKQNYVDYINKNKLLFSDLQACKQSWTLQFAQSKAALARPIDVSTQNWTVQNVYILADVTRLRRIYTEMCIDYVDISCCCQAYRRVH